MSLSLASSIAQSALASTSTQVSIVSRNIDGANDPNYSRKIANLTTSQTGSGELVSISRAADKALYEKLLFAQSGGASQQALLSGLDQMEQTIGDPASGQSPSALLANLVNALQTYSASPSDLTVAQSVITAASNLTNALNGATATVQGVRSQADADMSTSVQTINQLLAQFQTVNAAIVRGSQSGADITDSLDTRDSILSQLSQQMGITTTTAANGSVSIYTDSGVTLFQDTPRTVTFQATGTFTAGTTGNAVFVDGVPITGSSSPMPLQSGKLAGLSALRDQVAVTYQSQLDETARGLIDAFQETDQSATPTLPAAAGLFTYASVTTVPVGGLVAGLAGQIKINANVDPSQGGTVTRLRDGGISSPGNPAYGYNPSGAASFTGRIQQLIDGVSVTQSFAPTTGLNASASLTGFATASVSWLEAARRSVSDKSDYQNTLVSNASTALSNATGVNLDSEMSKMLDLEHAYQASSKLLSTVDNLYTALFQAVG